MNLMTLIDQLSLNVLSGKDYLNREVDSVYCSDMLSRVMAGASKDGALITVQTHMNVIAIASLIELACVIFPEGLETDEKVLEMSEKEGIPILSSTFTAYELAGKLFIMGIGKNN